MLTAWTARGVKKNGQGDLHLAEGLVDKLNELRTSLGGSYAALRGQTAVLYTKSIGNIESDPRPIVITSPRCGNKHGAQNSSA